MAEPLTVFLFRDDHFSGAGGTVVSAAPAEAVAAVFGGGGFRESEGVAAAFGGAAVYLDDERARCWLAVRGRRKASRFRAALRAGGFALTIRRDAPPGRGHPDLRASR